MEIYVVTSTLHMGMDGDYTSINMVTTDSKKANLEKERIDKLPSEEYNWYSSELTSYTLGGLSEKIQRIEDYPTCMSCYATVDEMNAAEAMKETILKILKEEK